MAATAAEIDYVIETLVEHAKQWAHYPELREEFLDYALYKDAKALVEAVDSQGSDAPYDITVAYSEPASLDAVKFNLRGRAL